MSIGDWHTTRTLAEAGGEEATRFFGLVRECGLHMMEHADHGSRGLPRRHYTARLEVAAHPPGGVAERPARARAPCEERYF